MCYNRFFNICILRYDKQNRKWSHPRKGESLELTAVDHRSSVPSPGPEMTWC